MVVVYIRFSTELSNMVLGVAGRPPELEKQTLRS
jgi:hypothetical protein